MDYIPDSYMKDYTYASIKLPSSSDDGYSNNEYFTHFEIYYRIYISAVPPSGSGLINTSTLMSNVNSALNSDYQGLLYLTNKTSTSSNPSNLETTFSNRKYFKLTLKEDNIDSVLSTDPPSGRPDSRGKILEIDFYHTISGDVIPVLTLSTPPGIIPIVSNTYTLQRATSGPGLNFTPKPNRDFFNHSELYDDNNVSKLINEDVAAPNAGIPATPRYTYVSMYIFAVGRHYITTIYSQPTHINIFCLPD